LQCNSSNPDAPLTIADAADVLGIPLDKALDAVYVKSVRRRLFLELHPDKWGNDAERAARFAIVKAALEFLLKAIENANND